LPNLARLSADSDRLKLGDPVEVLELEAQSGDLLPKTGEVVLIGSSDLFDQAVGAQSFHQAGDLARVFAFHPSAQFFVLEATDVELASAQCFE
jgi:hypothetical protein